MRELAPDEFRVQFTHSPNADAPTRRVDVYRLPAGAVLVDAEGFETRTREGAIELVRSAIVPPRGSVATSFSYRLEGAHVGLPGPHVVHSIPERGATDVDPDLQALSVTYDADMRNPGWAWVETDGATYPKAGKARFVDARTCEVQVRLQPDHDYVVWVNYPPEYVGFYDVDGRAAAPYELRFHTRPR